MAHGSQGMRQPGQSNQGERGRLLRDEEAQRGAGINLVDHPDYEAPRLKSTWGQMLPRMCVGCLILVGILGLMGGAVWSIVSDAPGDPLHVKSPPAGYATLPKSKDALAGGGINHNSTSAVKKDNGASMFSWFKGVLKDGGH